MLNKRFDKPGDVTKSVNSSCGERGGGVERHKKGQIRGAFTKRQTRQSLRTPPRGPSVGPPNSQPYHGKHQQK